MTRPLGRPRKALAPVVFVAGLVAFPATGQDESDAGFIGRQIENALSGPGRVARVSGFEGALSGRATMARLTFADADGVWLTLEDAVLDWNRAALLRGRLSVNELIAGRIALDRTPLPAPSDAAPEAPAPEASGFALPELPVSVNIGALRIGLLELAEPILGEEALFRMNGRVRLEGGEADLALNLNRLEGPEDRIGLEASFSNESRELALDLTVREGPDGLASALLGIPGAPSLALDIDGEGPLDDYTALVDFSTQGVQRLGGQITLRGTDDNGLRFAADVGGDITPVIAPDFADFFGPDVALVVDGVRDADGALRLDELDISARSLDLAGTAVLDADGRPERFELSGRLADPDGGPVRLPAGPQVSLDGASLTAGFDRANDDAWTLDLVANAVEAPQIDIGQLSLRGGGVILLDPTVSVTAGLTYAATDVAPEDQALAAALGRDITGAADLVWQSDAALELNSMTLGGSDYGAELAGTAEIAERTLLVEGEASVTAQDLARFSAISGQDLTGRASVALAGSGDVLGGVFDVALDLDGEDLSIGEETADRFLEGPVTLGAAARRDLEGTYLDRFALDSTGVEATAEGTVGSGLTDIGFQTTLKDVALLVPDYEGALTVEGRARETTPALYDVEVTLDGPYALNGEVAGLVGTGSSQQDTRVTLSLAVPDLAPVVPQVSGPASVEGIASAAGTGLWDVDLAIEAPAEAAVTVDGRLGGGQGNVDLTADIPDVAAYVDGIPGAVRLNGQAQEQTGGQWQVNLQSELPYEATAEISGVAGPEDIDIAYAAEVPDVAALVPSLTGALSAAGGVKQVASGRFDVTAAIDGPYASEAIAKATVGGGASGAERIRADVELSVPDLSPFSPALEGGLSASAQAEQQESGAFNVALEADGPFASSAEAEGVVGSGQTNAEVRLRVPDIGAVVPQLNGPVEAVATARESEPGRFYVTADIDGPYAATAAATASLGGGEDGTERIEAEVDLSVPDLSPLSPVLRGGLTAEATAQEQQSGAFEIALDATGPFDSTARAEGSVGGGDTNATASIRLPDIGPLVPQFSGAITTDIAAQQAPGSPIDVQVSATAPYGTTLDLDGEIAAGASALRLAASIPNISPFAPGLTGAVNVEGTAAEQPDGWAVDLQSRGPVDATATVAGTVAPDGSGANLRINGAAPLALANGILAPQRIDGDLDFDLALDGAPGLDALSGTISTSGAVLQVPAINLVLEQIGVTGQLGDERISLDVSAQSSEGGSVSVSGPIDLSGSFPANLAIAIDGFRLSDPALFQTSVDGNIAISGPLAGQGGAISGRIDIGETEVRVPSGGGGFGGAIPEVTHLSEPAEVFLSRERAGLVVVERESQGGGGGGPVFGLDLTISAPQQIFIRGRGLDAELGGILTLGGTTQRPAPVGGIEVIRGRVDILGKRIDLERDGRVTLGGDLVPFLDLTATSKDSEYSFVIAITGPVDAPEFSFTSSPSLPEDEVLARFLFGKSISDLSPLQAAQLASSLASLTGRGGPGLLGGLREGLGLDDLNLVTDADGGTALQFGQYLTDNIYTDVVTSSSGGTEFNINIDVTDDVTVSGSADNRGETTLGIFYERDY